MTAVGIVEDHALFRAVLRAAVENMPDLEVVFEAEDGDRAMTLLGEHDVQLVLVDLSLPRSNGIQLVAAIVEGFPSVRCVMVSGHNNQVYVRRALDAGAVGYVLKGDPQELREGIDQALAGTTYVSPTLSTS